MSQVSIPIEDIIMSQRKQEKTYTDSSNSPNFSPTSATPLATETTSVDKFIKVPSSYSRLSGKITENRLSKLYGKQRFSPVHLFGGEEGNSFGLRAPFSPIPEYIKDGTDDDNKKTHEEKGIRQTLFAKYFVKVTKLTWVFYLLQCFFGLACMVVSLVIYCADHERGIISRKYSFFDTTQSPSNMDAYTEVLRWALIFVFLLGLGVFVFRLLDLSPFIVSGLSHCGAPISTATKDEFIHFLKLKGYLSWSLFWLGLAIFFLCIFKEQRVENSHLLDKSKEFYFRRISVAIFIFVFLKFWKKWLIQRSTIYFQSIHYADRVAENTKCLNFIETLRRFAIRKSQIHIKQQHHRKSSQFKNEGHEYGVSDSEDQLGYVNLTCHARESAQLIYDALRPSNRPPGSNILPEDFSRVFPPDTASHAFEAFDKDANRDLSFDELHKGIIDIYIERDQLLKALEEGIHIIKHLETLLSAVFGILCLFLWLPVFEMPLNTFGPFATIFLASGFIIGPMAAKLLASLVLVFITHPYDVGDRVTFDRDNENMIVEEIGLLTTTCIQMNGKRVYFQNSNLANGYIQNIRRSQNQAEEITFDAPTSTALERIYLLKEKVDAFMELEARNFNYYPEYFNFNILDQNKIRISIWLEHKSNFQDHLLKTSRRNKFNLFLIQATQELGIVQAK